MSGSQDQKERKTASTVTTIFLEQKITSAQIRFCNDRWPSRLVEWTNNEHIKITLLATHSPKKWKKNCTTKNRLKDEHIKRHIWHCQIETTWRLRSDSNWMLRSKKSTLQLRKKLKPHFRTTTKATTKQQQQRQQQQQQRQQQQQQRQQLQQQQHSQQGSSEWWFSNWIQQLYYEMLIKNIWVVIKKTRPVTSKIDEKKLTKTILPT